MAEQLIVGKRYWLDWSKDVSGIFQGIDEAANGTIFSDITGPDKGYYMEDENGIVCFSGELPEITQETGYSNYED